MTQSTSQVKRQAYLDEPKWKTLFETGAIALLVEGIAYLVIVVTSSMIGAPPGNNFQFLNALAAHPSAAYFTYGVIALAHLTLLPGAITLYLALKNVDKKWMTIATGIIFFYVVVDILTFVQTAISLVSLSQSAQTASVLAAEKSELLIMPLSQFFGWVVPPVAFVIWISTMRKAHMGAFSRVFGFFTVLFSVVGGISFLVPTYASLQNFQASCIGSVRDFLHRFRDSDIKAPQQTSSVATSGYQVINKNSAEGTELLQSPLFLHSRQFVGGNYSCF